MKKLLKKTKLVLPLCFWMITSWQAFAQEVQIQGKVRDSVTNETLPGVNIVIKGTTKGVTTGSNGTYQISAPKGSTLVFSYLSYKSQEIQVENSITIDVALHPEVEKLQEIVVIGYGTVKKEDATGSVSAVSAKDFNKGIVASPQDALVGKIAGVVVTSVGGAPGASSTIRIRGGSSLTASNDPLIVVDGIPLDNGAVSGSPNALTMINPNDIESITVLKDASATAIYGSRASNGVIMITTKKAGQKLKISYSGEFSLVTLPKKLNVLNGDEYRAVVKEEITNGHLAPSVANLLDSSNTDWQKEIYRTAFVHDHNLSVSGTAKKLPYRLSLGYTNEDGTLKTTNFQRTTADLNLNPSLLDDHLKINLNIKGMYNTNNFGSTDAIGGAVSFNPTMPVYNGNTRWRGYTTWTTDNTINGPARNLATANPVARLDLTDNTSDVQRSVGNVQFDYKLHFLPDLHYNLNLGYDYSKSAGRNNIADSTGWTYNSAYTGGRKENYSQIRRKELLETYLNYEKNIDALQSKINIMGGYSHEYVYRDNRDSAYNNAENYRISINNTKTRYYLISFFGRLNFDVMDKYLLTFTIRNDGTSRFSPDNRWGLFPSAALAWKIKNESFLKSTDVVSDLKLRLGYGVTGQQDLNTGDFPYLAVYRVANPTIEYQLGNTFYSTLRPNGYDANIKWETTTTNNIGLDFGFFKNRITGTIEYYQRKTKDLISQVNTAAGTNLTNVIVSNVGNMENKGVELSLNLRIISKSDLFWEVGTNLSSNKNKITNLSLSDDPNYFIQIGNVSGGTGNKIQVHKVGYPAYSFYVYQQVYDQNGKPLEGVYVDRNKDGVINSNDLYTYKKPAPDVLMGISSSVGYKNLELSFSGRLSLGNYVYNNVASGSTYLNLYTGNFMSNVNYSASETKFHTAQYLSDYYIENASFFRMDNISLAYKLPPFIQGKVQVRITGTVKNAFVITKYKGLDPEVDGGIDNNFYPRSRTYLLGLNLDF